VVGSFATGEECKDAMPTLEANVLVTDIDLGPGISGPNLGVELRRTTTIRGVVLLSNLALPSVLSSIPQDVSGGWAYLLKTSVSNVNQVGRAIMNAAQGNVLIDDALVDELRCGTLPTCNPYQGVAMNPEETEETEPEPENTTPVDESEISDTELYNITSGKASTNWVSGCY